MIYLKLFWSFFQIGLFSFGGGYASLPLIREQIVNTNHWLSMKEFVDIVTISQMTPGPVAINSSTFVGTRVAGLPGAVVATLGCIMPSCIIVMILALIYIKYKDMWVVKGILSGLRPAVVSLIASAGLGILLLPLFNGAESWFGISLSAIDIKAAILFVAALIVLRKFKTDPVFVMMGSGLIGYIFYQVI